MKHFFQVLAAFVLLFGAHSADAQKRAITRQVITGLHFQQVNFNDFNNQSGEMGYPALGESLFEINAGFALQDGRWRTGFGTHIGWMQERAPLAGPEARYEQLGLNLSTAFNLINDDSPWLLGPEINLLFQGSLLTLSQAAAISRLDQAAEAEYVKLTRLSSPIEFGIMAQREIAPRSEDGNTFLLGLRAGYRMSDDEGWRLDQAVDFNDSGIRPGGWFLSLFFGGSIP